jgi:hypothetical protein
MIRTKLEPTLHLQTKHPDIETIKSLCVAAPRSSWAVDHQYKFLRLTNEQGFATPALKLLAEKFGGRACVLMTDPHRMYNWHRDGARGCAINIMVHQGTAFSFHGYLTEFPIQTRLKPVDYGPVGTCVLFNTQREHCVVNLEQPRYIISLSFNENISYDDLYAHCIENGV